MSRETERASVTGSDRSETGRPDVVPTDAGATTDELLGPGPATAETAATRSGAAAPGLMWGVGAVSTRLGIATPTLRTWERRYGIGPRSRTAGGHRRYSEEDVSRVSVMSRLAARGVPPQAAARVALSLDPRGLADALASPESAAPHLGASVAPMASTRPDAAVDGILRAAIDLDAVTLRRIYASVIAERGIVAAWSEVLAPALREIGDRWFDGTLGVDAEHLASEMLSTELRGVVRGRRPQRMARPPVVLASAEDELHSLPLLATEAALAHEGRAGYALGGRLPAPALTDMVQRVQPGVVLLWASIARPSRDLVWGSFEDVTWPLTLLLGGPGWREEHEDLGPDVEVRAMTDLRGTVETITELTTVG